MSGKILFTIGYEKALLKDVIAALTAAGVEILLDVRDRPISRRPGFSKRQLGAAVEDAGMRYVHLAALGYKLSGVTHVIGVPLRCSVHTRPAAFKGGEEYVGNDCENNPSSRQA